MKIWFRTPYSIDKNLGHAYNQEMELIPDGDAACFTDGDTLFLTHDFGHLISEYANQYPNSVLTCRTNRIHPKAEGQYYPMIQSSDIKEHLKLNQKVSTVTKLDGPISGFLLVIPKHIWLKHPFTEENLYRPGTPNLLGVDNEWTNRIREKGVDVLRMDGIYIWHTYRLLTGSKNHLL
jgi:hypothetical protein